MRLGVRTAVIVLLPPACTRARKAPCCMQDPFWQSSWVSLSEAVFSSHLSACSMPCVSTAAAAGGFSQS